MDTFGQNLVTAAVVGSAMHAVKKDPKNANSCPDPIVSAPRKRWYQALWHTICASMRLVRP